MDDEADFGVTAREGVEDLVEGDDDVVEFFLEDAEEELEGEKGAGHEAGDGDFAGEHFIAGEGAFADEHGAVVVAHAGAATEEGVVLEDVGVGVDGDGGDVELSAGGAFVEGLNVLKDVLEFVTGRGEEVFGERVEHEGVVGIGRMAKREFHKGSTLTEAVEEKSRACVLFQRAVFAEFFGEIGEADFIRMRIIGDEEFANGFEEGGTFLNLLLEAGCVGLGSGLFGKVGGLKGDAVEPVADFVDERLEKIFEFLLREAIGRLGIWGGGVQSLFRLNGSDASTSLG